MASRRRQRLSLLKIVTIHRGKRPCSKTLKVIRSHSTCPFNVIIVELLTSEHGGDLFACHRVLLQIEFEFLLDHHICHLNALWTIKRSKGSLIPSLFTFLNIAIHFGGIFLFQGIYALFGSILGLRVCGICILMRLILLSKKFRVHFFLIQVKAVLLSLRTDNSLILLPLLQALFRVPIFVRCQLFWIRF